MAAEPAWVEENLHVGTACHGGLASGLDGLKRVVDGDPGHRFAHRAVAYHAATSATVMPPAIRVEAMEEEVAPDISP